MSEGWVCGTGGGNFPKPGDPDSNVILKATPAFGGIDVEWTYPNLNPHAVAHTILYRSTSGDVNSAVRHAVVSGNFFYDKSTSPTLVEYFYWIQIVSVNGTYSEMIGPASATAKPTIEQMIELLTGQIDAGVLAQSLKTEIGKIQLNKLAIDRELLALAENDDALGAAYNEVVAFTENTRALLQQETLARADANSAFATRIDTLYANIHDVVAAVQVETDARVTADRSLASQITTTQSQLGDQIASVQTGMQTKIDTVNGKVTEIGALYTAKVDVNGLIGGFGVYNDGKIVEAGFDVDRFWIGRTTNKRKPFIIEGNQVYIDEAAINRLVFSKLRDESGSFVVQNGKVKADYITIGNAAIDTAHIKDASITTAKIKDLAVDTLKIAGNAVTVPKFAMAGMRYGNDGVQDVVSLWFDVPANSWLYASASASLGYSREQGIDVGTALYIGGVSVAAGGGRFYYITAAHSGAVFFPTARSVQVTLQFRGDSGVHISSSSLFAMVVRR